MLFKYDSHLVSLFLDISFLHAAMTTLGVIEDSHSVVSLLKEVFMIFKFVLMSIECSFHYNLNTWVIIIDN